MDSYVLVYERSTGALQHEESGPGRRAEAFARRLVLERQVGPGVEVIVLHGDSLEDLRTTHRRCFEDVSQLFDRLAASIDRKTWRTWDEVADVFDGPADPGWASDRDPVDQGVEDPWERHGGSSR